MAENINGLRSQTQKYGSALGLAPHEVVACTWVFHSMEAYKAYQHSLTHDLMEIKRTKRRQVRGDVHPDVATGQLPVTEGTIRRLAPSKRMDLRSLWSLTTGEDTKLVFNQIENGWTRGARTRILNEAQKTAIGVRDSVVAVTTIKLRADSEILRQVRE